MLNLELKARCEDLGKLRERCESLGAEGQEPERQVDTYFNVSHGRLKLRESLESGAELIYYIRDDVAGAQESHYELYRVEDAEGLKAMLAKALGINIVVAKRRETFVLDNIRIHLDKTQGLGSFVELHGTIDEPGELPIVADEVQGVQRALGIDPQSLVGESYATLAGSAEAV
ncbi:MAG: class IV adenylate cyclase [Candidatus Methylomirabilis oxygeniifera]|uniref:Putative Adenylate cyclase n=1 Tax=Methylomirabilis oxygeniifera TaxID=671143 RepID=D5MLV1_METO1|nr:MAG: class IV adenylate cyclase [Candidatus Methylomirabilis oxyfera]CBE70008.1 putative Adenylate cyclase [Candidatus Methylomirabilis oxyfera]